MVFFSGTGFLSESWFQLSRIQRGRLRIFKDNQELDTDDNDRFEGCIIRHAQFIDLSFLTLNQNGEGFYFTCALKVYIYFVVFHHFRYFFH